MVNKNVIFKRQRKEFLLLNISISAVAQSYKKAICEFLYWQWLAYLVSGKSPGNEQKVPQGKNDEDGLNWFAYVGNEPINRIDRWGLSASDSAIAGEDKLPWPTESHRVTSEFGPDHTDGIDIGGTIPGVPGDDITAIQGGSTRFVGVPSQSTTRSPYVIITGNDGKEYRYVHITNIEVKKDDKVTQGQKIAEMSDEGTEAVHLHLEIIKDGVKLNPVDFLE